MYIGYVAYLNRTTTVTNPNEHTVLYVLRAPGPDCSMYHLSDTNTTINYSNPVQIGNYMLRVGC
jgi:hypothetical protein